MKLDVTEVADRVGLQVLTTPPPLTVTGAFLVAATGQATGGVGGVPGVGALPVLSWPGGTGGTGGMGGMGGMGGGVSAQPLDLVLARLRHVHRSAAVAVAASPPGSLPPRATLSAATDAGVGLLWTSHSTADEVVTMVQQLISSAAPDSVDSTDDPAVLVASVLRDGGDAEDVHTLTHRLAAVLDAAVTVRGTAGEVFAVGLRPQADAAPPEDEPPLLEHPLRHGEVVVGAVEIRRPAPLPSAAAEALVLLLPVLVLAARLRIAERSQAEPGQAQLALILGDDLQAREAALRRSRRLRLFPSRRMTLLVVEPFAQPLGRRGLTRLAEQFAAPLHAADPASTLLAFEGGLVLLVSAHTDTEALVRSFRRTAAIPLSVGASRTLGEIRNLPGAYREAARAATIGRRLGAANQVTRYEELGLLRLLYQLPEHERRAYVDEVLGPVAGRDAEAAEQRRIVRTLHATHGNLAEAARQLFVHRNTLRSRVARLETLLGPFTEDPDRRAAVFVAMELHRLDDDGDGIGGSPLSGRRGV